MDFICATTPVAQQSGGTVPLVVALQLSNDYAYIASKLATSEPSSVWTAQTLCAQRFKAASDLWRNVCVEEQFVGLASVLDGARHFVDMSHDSFYHQAEDSVRTAVSQLETTAADTKVGGLAPLIADPYQSVLVNDQYFILLGSLVESVVTRLLDDIVALDDITEVESERISSILSLVETLDHLFQSPLGDVSTIAAHVPHWLKFCYLKEILVSCMKRARLPS
jgi:centromere/kinetochore protein ZW10